MSYPRDNDNGILNVFFLVKALYVTFFFPCRDRFITVVNVVGDAMGTGIVEHLSRDELNNNSKTTHLTEKFPESDGPNARLMTSGV